LNPLWPWVLMTMRSISCSLAYATMFSSAAPSRRAVVT
jgi:hypothetical protein